uniref:Uncharacterized protein n=1 Tax=Chlamydomonas euryale TaxID=1486919 RepID=A0A7R9Z1M7_9CHLO|eukprot:349862-Chlamydomonas_euryale.AAC.2
MRTQAWSAADYIALQVHGVRAAGLREWRCICMAEGLQVCGNGVAAAWRKQHTIGALRQERHDPMLSYARLSKKAPTGMVQRAGLHGTRMSSALQAGRRACTRAHAGTVGVQRPETALLGRKENAGKKEGLARGCRQVGRATYSDTAILLLPQHHELRRK